MDQPDLVTVPVLREELLVVTAAKHPLSRKRKVLPQDLVRQPFVLFESGSNTPIDEFFMSARIEPDIVMETENVEIIKAMVRARRRHQHHPLPGRGPGRVERPPVLFADRGLAGAGDRLGLPTHEPNSPFRLRDDQGVRAGQAEAPPRSVDRVPRPAPMIAARIDGMRSFYFSAAGRGPTIAVIKKDEVCR